MFHEVKNKLRKYKLKRSVRWRVIFWKLGFHVDRQDQGQIPTFSILYLFSFFFIC